MQPYTQRYKI